MDEVKRLIKKLKDYNWDVRRDSADALGKIGDKRAVEPLIEALKDPDSLVRGNAAKVLSKIGKPAVEPLIEALKDSDWRARYYAAETLGEIGDKRAVEPLIETLKDSGSWVRRRAAEASGKIRDRRAVEALVETLKDSDWCVREYTAWALGEIGDIKGLILLLHLKKKDDDKDCRKAASKAIEKVISCQPQNIDAYPHLFCDSCFMRAKKGKARLGLFKSVKYAACRGCGSSILKTGIKEVIGLIDGKGFDEVRIKGHRAYVRLWDNGKKEARGADIDVLEIHNSSDIDYHRAINAVLLELRADIKRPRDVKDIPVRLIGNPQLTKGEISMINKEFKGII